MYVSVATSSTRPLLELKTSEKHGSLFSLFSHIVTGCDPAVERGKPHPDIYNIARAKFTGTAFRVLPMSHIFVYREDYSLE
jgi:beta-phosphoglucomutase-like phosphatase (HAD superfamily)